MTPEQEDQMVKQALNKNRSAFELRVLGMYGLSIAQKPKQDVVSIVQMPSKWQI